MPDIDENSTNWCTAAPQRQLVQQADGIQLGPEHGVHVVVGHVGQRHGAAAEGGQVDALQRGQIRAEPIEQRRHRGSVGGIGRHREQSGARCGQAFGQFVQPAAGVTRNGDDGLRPHSRQLSDQRGTDVSGRTDDEVAAIRTEHGIALGRRDTPFEPWHIPCARAVHDLVLAVVGLRLGEHPAGGQDRRHSLVEIDDPAPDFGMFKRQRAPQSPQDGMCRVGAIAFPDRLSIAGDDHQTRRRARGAGVNQLCDKHSGLIEEPVRRCIVEVRTGDRRCVEHVIGAADRVLDVFADPEHRCVRGRQAAELGSEFCIGQHDPPSLAQVAGRRHGTCLPGRLVKPLSRAVTTYLGVLHARTGGDRKRGDDVGGVDPVVGRAPRGARQRRVRFCRVLGARRVDRVCGVEVRVELDGVVAVAP